MKLRQNNISSF